MKVAVALVFAGVVASGCLISPVIPIGSGTSAKQAQHDSLGKLFPAQLTTSRTWPGEVRVAKVRVWADDEYRAQNMRWQHGFDEQLDYVNQVLAPLLGVRLEAEYRSWEHHMPAVALMDHLEALARQDAGDDVVWIVGLTSSLSLVSATFDQLGIARVGERHLVMRGHADIEERKAFERAFPDLKAEERASVLEARRRHKTTAVLLHELAHSLGALHETEKAAVMSPSYSHLAAAISDRNRDVMAITLEERLKPAGARDPRASMQRLLTAFEVEWPGWDPGDREEATRQLREQLGARTNEMIAGPVPSTVIDQFRRAEQQLASGRHEEALSTLEPLQVAYPGHAEIRVLGCRIELARAAKDARAIAACDRAASSGVEAAISVAAARLAVRDVAGARATLAAAETRIAGLAPDRASSAWLALAVQYRWLNALALAEQAVARTWTSPAAQQVIDWATSTRVRYGIPRDGARFKLTADNDADAAAAVRGVLDLVYANKFAAADKAAAAAEKTWPGLPGLLAARCDLEVRRGALGAARQLCKRAIANGPSSWALYMSGIIELRSPGRAATAAGIARLREAIDLDPELSHAWRALGKALDRANAKAELEDLRREYRGRFNTLLLW